MRGRGDWRAALLLLAAAATAREVVRLGYFTEAQPFEVACARGWFEAADLEIEVVCLPQSAGVGAVSKIDDGDLELSLLGSTPAAAAIARGVRLQNFYVHELYPYLASWSRLRSTIPTAPNPTTPCRSPRPSSLRARTALGCNGPPRASNSRKSCVSTAPTPPARASARALRAA